MKRSDRGHRDRLAAHLPVDANFLSGIFGEFTLRIYLIHFSVRHQYVEVDHRFITFAALSALLREGQISSDIVSWAIKESEINPEKLNPATA